MGRKKTKQASIFTHKNQKQVLVAQKTKNQANNKPPFSTETSVSMDVLCTMLLWSKRVRSTGNKNIIIDPKHYWREEGIEGGGKRDGERRRGVEEGEQEGFYAGTVIQTQVLQEHSKCSCSQTCLSNLIVLASHCHCPE